MRGSRARWRDEALAESEVEWHDGSSPLTPHGRALRDDDDVAAWSDPGHPDRLGPAADGAGLRERRSGATRRRARRATAGHHAMTTATTSIGPAAAATRRRYYAAVRRRIERPWPRSSVRPAAHGPRPRAEAARRTARAPHRRRAA